MFNSHVIHYPYTMNHLLIIGILGIPALAVSCFGVAAIRRVVQKRQFLDIPN